MSNKNSIIAAIKRLQKVVEYREGFQKININIEGNYILTNAYYLIEFEKIIDIDKNILDIMEITDTNTKLSYDDIARFANCEDVKECEIKIADLQKLHKFNKANKTKKFFMIKNEYKNDYIYFNADLLLDILTLTDYKEKTVKLIYNNSYTNPFLVKLNNSNIKALLLPIHCKYTHTEKKERDFKELQEILAAELPKKQKRQIAWSWQIGEKKYTVITTATKKSSKIAEKILCKYMEDKKLELKNYTEEIIKNSIKNIQHCMFLDTEEMKKLEEV